MITNVARAVLFGKKNNRMTFNMAAKASFLRAVGRDSGMPTLTQYAGHLAKNALATLFGIRDERTIQDRLPIGWPSDVFAIAAKEIAEKGGVLKLPEGQVVPAFHLTAKGAQVLPHLWVAYIRGNADYDKVAGLGDAIRESLAQAGKRLTVRVVPFPLRMEIDRPDAKVITLADVWAGLKRQQKNAYEYVTGFYFDNTLKVGFFDLFDAREWSGIIAGASGSGKSQFSLSMLLSMALNTSPENLSLVIGDPKCADLLALSGLPHLAYGRILSEIDDIKTAVKAVEAEMDRRIKAGDKSIVRKRIVLFLDEWADISQLDKTGEIEASIVRLGLKGRFWGINLFLATQKTTSAVLSTLVLANLVARFCLRVGSVTESTFVSGQPGCYAHKLPGKGAILTYNPHYNDGLREQGFYVGDPADPAYDKIVGAYVADISAEWPGLRPHWAPGMPAAPEMVQDELPMPKEEPKRGRGRPSVDVPDDLLDAIDAAEEQKGGPLSEYGIRVLSKKLYGKRLSSAQAKDLHDALYN